MTNEEIEKKIVTQLLTDILAAGHCVSINDGEELVIKRSRIFEDILAVMFTTGGDTITVRTGPEGDRFIGEIWLIYGNGHEVIHDCNTNPVLLDLMKGAEKLAEDLGENIE